MSWKHWPSVRGLPTDRIALPTNSWTAAILHVACFLDLFLVSPHSFFGHSKVWGSDDHLAVEGGGGGGGYWWFQKKNILQNDFQGKNICTKKKISWRIMLGKKTCTVIWRGKLLTKPNHPHLPRPPPQKSNGRLGPGKSKMADVYSVGTQVDLLYLFITWDVTLVEF